MYDNFLQYWCESNVTNILICSVSSDVFKMDSGYFKMITGHFKMVLFDL